MPFFRLGGGKTATPVAAAGSGSPAKPPAAAATPVAAGVPSAAGGAALAGSRSASAEPAGGVRPVTAAAGTGEAGGDAAAAAAAALPAAAPAATIAKSAASGAASSVDGGADSSSVELDICEVTPRIIACGRPTSRETDVEERRNNVSALGQHLDLKYSDNYLVVNLSNKNRNKIDYTRFHNSVLEFQPFSRSDLSDDTPGMGQVFRICYALKFWLEWGPETIAVLHCNNGIYRTGFILACFLVYVGQFRTIAEALAFFTGQREGDVGASLFERFMPSWRYLITQIERHMHMPAALPKVWRLNYIILNAPGLSKPTDLEFPAVQIYEGPKVIFDSTKDCVPEDGIRWEDGKLLVEVDRIVCGDCQVWVLTAPRPRPSGGGIGGMMASDPTSGSGFPQSGIEESPGATSTLGHSRMVRRHAARFAFHSSMLGVGLNTFTAAEVDLWVGRIDRKGFNLTLLTAPVPTETILQSSIDKAVKRSYINLQGAPAIVKGAEEFSAHHYVFPDAKLLKTLVGEGNDETAAVCALQRSLNQLGRTREFLNARIIKEHFKENAAQRDLKLLRETLSIEEVATALAARSNIGRRKKGAALEELDVEGLLKAAKLGELGAGGGLGPGGGKGRRRKKGKGGKDGADDDSEDADDDDARADDDDEEDEEEDGVDAFLGGTGGGGGGDMPKLFEGDDGAKADGDEDDDEGPMEEDAEEEGGPWLMKEHPIFGRWFKMLADGKSKADVAAELAKEAWNPALLEQSPDAPVPEGVAASNTPLKDWEFFQKYFKMMKIGLPRPVVEHKMISEGANPAILDADQNSQVMATDVSPPKKGKKKGPQIIRKKLHWVPIRGKIESTIWAGPPGDLIAAATQLIDNEKEFQALFIQNPEDLKKKKKKGKDEGPIQLIDGKRAMNCGIALAKMKASFSTVTECLTHMACRNGKHLLTTTELANLVTLCPTDDEVKAVKGFKGDVKRLGQAEQFMLAVADVPMARARAQGLVYQAGFDERIKEAYARIRLFTTALEQVKGAARLQRLLKAVLVLGNKMNGVTKKNKKQLVKAFTINSLHQLYLTKAFDQQTSVLQYLIKLLKRKDPDLLRLSKDFKGEILAEAKRLPLDVMNLEMTELREGLTALEAVVREAAQAGQGWSAIHGSGGGGPMYVEEVVDAGEKDDRGDADNAGSHAAKPSAASTGSAGSAVGGDGTGAPAGAASGDGGADRHDDDAKPRHKRKKVRRRVEPLPEFTALAQTELSKLEQAFSDAQAGYKGMLKFWKEDAEMPADEMFGNLHSFIQTFDATLKAMIDKKRKAKEAKKRAREMARNKRRAARRRAAIENGEEPPDNSDDDDGSVSGSSASGSSASSAASDDESVASSDFDDDETAAKKTAASGWTNAVAAAGDDASEESDAEEEDDPPSGAAGAASGGGGHPRAALLAAISGKAGGSASSGGAGTGDTGSSGTADPRAGLLAAIKKKGGGGADGDAAASASGGAGGGGGDPRAGMLAAIKAKGGGSAESGGSQKSSTGGAGPAASGDPRAGLLGAIKARGAAAASGGGSSPAAPAAGVASAAAAGHAHGDSDGASASSGLAKKRHEEDEQKKKDTGWHVGTTDDDDPEAGGRNAMMAAIKARRKE